MLWPPVTGRSFATAIEQSKERRVHFRPRSSRSGTLFLERITQCAQTVTTKASFVIFSDAFALRSGQRHFEALALMDRAGLALDVGTAARAHNTLMLRHTLFITRLQEGMKKGVLTGRYVQCFSPESLDPMTWLGQVFWLAPLSTPSRPLSPDSGLF